MSMQYTQVIIEKIIIFSFSKHITLEFQHTYKHEFERVLAFLQINKNEVLQLVKSLIEADPDFCFKNFTYTQENDITTGANVIKFKQV